MPTKPLKYMSNVYQGPSHITEDDPNAIEFSNAAYDRMFSEEAGYPQRDPNAPRRTLPSGPQIDPRSFINDKLKELGDRSEAQYKAVVGSGLEPATIQRLAMGIQDEYDQAKGQLTSNLGQLGLIQQGVAAGELTAEAGREAAIRMIVPRETADLMFPSVRVEPRSRFTPSEFRSYVKAFTEDIETTIFNPWGWGAGQRKQADPDVLKEQYFANRAKYAYDTDLTVVERQAFDQAWDTAIANSPAKKAWRKMMREDPDLFTSRTYDSKLLDIAKEKARGTVSPIAKSVWRLKGTKKPPRGSDQRVYGALNFGRPQVEAGGKIRVVSPNGQTGTIDSSEWEQYQAQGFKRVQ